MSGLEALGIACNIMQVISFAHETIGFCKATYEGQSLNLYSEQSVASLSAISAQLQTRYQGVKSKTAQERELENVARKCNVAARALEEEVMFLTHQQAAGSLKRTLRIMLKIIWRKRRLERLEKSLRNHQQTMESHLLARVCTQSDAVEIQQREGFKKLGEDVQYFVSQYSAGHTKVADLVKMELISVKTQIAKESLRSEASVKGHISGEVTTAERAITAHVTKETNEIVERVAQVATESDMQASAKEQRDRLLQSLRYPAMNERKNDLANSYEGTFRWIFADGKDTNSTYDEDDPSDSNSNTSEISSIATSDSISEDDWNDFEDTPWDNFNDWLKSDSKIYWISGKPGSGKSTLMKYLLESPSTKAGLEIWNADPVILSHFFWKPGSNIQKNIKGFLCSILHQCFSFSMQVLDLVLATSKSLLLKDSVTDWSLKELKEVCLAVLRSYPSPLCIFLDGLDEVCEADGPLPILNMVDDIRMIPNVKICVASRPEPLLKSALSRHQHLRLQDLTENDMRKYSTAQIQPYIDTHRISPEFGSTTIDTLIYKAEGVFLWLQLAIRGLKRGIEYGDTNDELKQRLQDLPSELSDLYSDMWTRINGDSKIYREAAARYFNLLIASEAVGSWGDAFGYGPTLFHIMAATETKVQDSFINERTITDPETLWRLCEKTRHAVHVRCAGLLEIAQSRLEELSATLPSTKVWNPTYKRLIPHGTTVVQFIHRTAYDFMIDTEEGCRIRSHDPSDQGTLHVQLIKGNLVFAKVFQQPISYDFQVILDYLSSSIALSPLTTIHHLLRTVWDWYDGEYYKPSVIAWTERNIKLRPNFLTVAAKYPALQSFILSSIAESPNPPALAAEIARNINYVACLRRPHIVNLTQGLLYWSNSICSKGICYLTTQTSLFPFLTPLGSLLYQIFHEKRMFLADADISGRLLQTFIEANPDLDEHIPLLIDLNLPHASFRSLELLDDFTERFDLSEYNEHSGSISEYVLIDSTVAFLIKAFCEYCCELATVRVAKYSVAFFEDLKTRIENWNGLNSSPLRIKLVIIQMDSWDDEDITETRRFRPTTDVATEPLLSLVSQYLKKDSFLLAQIRKEFGNIRREICSKSAKFEEVYKTAREILAEERCGYCFVDENGHPISGGSNSDNDTNRGSNKGSPFEDHFYERPVDATNPSMPGGYETSFDELERYATEPYSDDDAWL
ncbi:histone H4-like TAF Taf6, SAGA complex subunit [Hypoxylon texense]